MLHHCASVCVFTQLSQTSLTDGEKVKKKNLEKEKESTEKEKEIKKKAKSAPKKKKSKWPSVILVSFIY